MAAAPKYKAYDPQGNYTASFKHAEDAANYAAFRGEGTKIKYDHTTLLWHEGHEEFSATESFDSAAQVMWSREPGPKGYEQQHL